MSSKKESALTAEELRDALTYSPRTGVFKWRRTLSNRSSQGSVAGCHDNGYVRIRLFGRIYMAHRLAWFYVTGTWPKEDIDHKDRNRSNNRLANLRLASRSENLWNTRKNPGKSSRYMGVFRVADPAYSRTPWEVKFNLRGRRIHLGYFSTEEMAARRYNTEVKKLRGDFANVNKIGEVA